MTTLEQALREAYGRIVGQPKKYRHAEWKTVGGGAPALIDVESGSILAGCPGLEDEDIEDITDEPDESRQRRRQKQEAAEAAGWESEETEDARKAWQDAKADMPVPDAVVLLQVGDTYYSFDDDAKILSELLGVGDGSQADFKEGALQGYVNDLVEAGHRVAIAERTEDGDARHRRTEAPDDRTQQDHDIDPWRQHRKRVEPKDRFTKAVVEAIGDDAEDVAGFKSLAMDIWKRKQQEAHDENASLRNLLSNFGVDGRRQGGFIRAVQQMRDPDRIKRFDEMVDMAQRDYPELLEYSTGEMAGKNDAEDALFQRLQRGLVKPPAKWSEEVIGEALEYVQAAERSTSRLSEEWDQVPFSRPSGRWWRAVRYSAKYSWDEAQHPRDSDGQFTDKDQRMGKPIKLWRASDDDIIVGSASFSTSREDAEAYLDNPGFGGGRLYSTSVEIDEDALLDLYDMSDDEAITAIRDVTGLPHPGAIGVDEWIPRIADTSDALRDAGIEWVRVRESYPEDSETYIFVGDDDPDMDEVG